MRSARATIVARAKPAGSAGAGPQAEQQPAAGDSQPHRLVLRGVVRGPDSINWDRWEMMMAAREAAAEAEAGEGEGEEVGEEGAASELAARLAQPELAAAYFARWDDPSRHLPLLQDRVVMGAWRDALAAAPPGALAGRVVLEVGCGPGLLAVLAAKAGAAHVYAVDGSAGAVAAARRIVRANGLADKITVIHGAIEDLAEIEGLAPHSVDLVLSHWMGPGLLAGGMAHGVATAVSRWLRPGGTVLPDRVALWGAGLEDRDALQEAKEAWTRVAGVDMTAALAEVIRHPRRDVLSRKSQLLTAPQRLAEWRGAELRPGGLVDAESGAYATCPLSLTALRDERLFGLVLWWEAVWDFGGALGGEGGGGAPVRLSTHPLAATTHYQQLMLDFPRSMRLAADDTLAGQVVLRPGATDPRDVELEVELGLQGAEAEPISATYRIAHS